MRNFIPWLKASRIPAQGFIFPSLLLGQAISYQISGSFSWSCFLLIHLYGLFMHLFIVYANDYADYETDRINTTFTPFTGGSRVLVEGGLKRSNLQIAAIAMFVLTLATGILISLLRANWFISLFILFGTLVLYSYSYKPIILSYRGFGEILQMIGVGVILPVVGFLAQGGLLNQFLWGIILILLPSQLAMAISTSLPDEPSDHQSRKRTTVIMIGAIKARMLIILLYVVTFILILYYQTISFTVPGNRVFIFLFTGLILLQLILLSFFSVKPGSKSLFFFVLFSILTNTAFSVWLTILLFRY